MSWRGRFAGDCRSGAGADGDDCSDSGEIEIDRNSPSLCGFVQRLGGVSSDVVKSGRKVESGRDTAGVVLSC